VDRYIDRHIQTLDKLSLLPVSHFMLDVEGKDHSNRQYDIAIGLRKYLIHDEERCICLSLLTDSTLLSVFDAILDSKPS
jgi:hypothetical protein